MKIKFYKIVFLPFNQKQPTKKGLTMFLSNLLISKTIISLNNFINILPQIISSDKIQTIIFIYPNHMQSEANHILTQKYFLGGNKTWLVLNTDSYDKTLKTDINPKNIYYDENYFILVISDNLTYFPQLKSLYCENSTVQLKKSTPCLLFMKDAPDENDTYNVLTDENILNIAFLYWKNDKIKIETINIAYNYATEINVTDESALHYDHIFRDLYQTANKEKHVLLQITVLNPPKVIFLTGTKESKNVISLGGVDAFLGRLINSYTNVKVEYLTFNMAKYLSNSSDEFKKFCYNYLEKMYVDNVSPIKVHQINESKYR